MSVLPDYYYLLVTVTTPPKNIPKYNHSLFGLGLLHHSQMIEAEVFFAITPYNDIHNGCPICVF